jgi:hypothetical protein
VEAVKELGKGFKYPYVMSPGSFHLWYAKKYIFEYKPDAVWLYNSNDAVRAVIWEIESKWPDTKRICGDAVLAMMIRSKHAFCYLTKDSDHLEHGTVLRTQRRSDWTRKVIGEIGNYEFSPEISAFFLLVEEYQTKRDIEPYIDAIKSKTFLFKETTVNVLHLPTNLNIYTMKERLRSDKRVKPWR